MGAYTSLYKDKMVLYQSQKGGLYRLRSFYFVFNMGSPNMSDKEWIREVDAKNRETFKLKPPASTN